MAVPTKIKTVLVGVDFSPYSLAAARQAQMLAKKFKCPLVFVHVFADPFVAEDADASIKHSLTKHYSQQVKKKYKLSAKDVIIVKCGTAFEEILAVAEKFTQPLVVVGAKGIGHKLSRLLLGSTAERLALHAQCPVLVHKGQKASTLQKLLIPFDFSTRSENVVTAAKSLGLNDSYFEFFHVFQPPAVFLDYVGWQLIYDAAKKMDEDAVADFKRRHASSKIITEQSYDVPDSINKRSRRFDAIAISPRTHKGILRSLGSVTSKIVRSGSKPVLILP